MKMIKSTSVAVLAFAVMAASSFAGQPNMQAALGHLRAARAALARAEHNKGGHRARAMEIVNNAIAEVEAGIAAGR